MTATTHECLDPLDRPILKDCDLVCADVRTMEGGIFLKLLEVWTHGRGHCMFGVANLDLCEHLSIDPVNVVHGYLTGTRQFQKIMSVVMCESVHRKLFLFIYTM